uniref:Serine hydrolase-like protein n=1 Tax=Hirondellea gigas TaxID=1518452 RepID=A0A6A7FXS0_9CRUS
MGKLIMNSYNKIIQLNRTNLISLNNKFQTTLFQYNSNICSAQSSKKYLHTLNLNPSQVHDQCRSYKAFNSNTNGTLPIAKQHCFLSYRCKNIFTKGRTYSTMTGLISDEPREFRIGVPNGHIAGKVWNESAKVAVLCLHGWQDNAGSFDLLAPLLPNHLCLVAFDFSGHGRSSHKPLGFSSTSVDYLITIDRVVKYYGWKQVIILGHSMGGGVGMIYAGARPKVVHTLIMLDMIKLLHLSPDSTPTRTEKALDVLVEVERKIMSKSRPAYPFDELLQRGMKSHAGSLDERGVRTLLKRGSIELPNGLHSFSYDLQITTPNLWSMTLDQHVAFAERMRCRLMILRADAGLWVQEKKYFDDIIEKYRSSCSEFVFLTVPGTHHFHLRTPETAAVHIAEFLSVEKLEGFSNNVSESGGSVVTEADKKHGRL